MPASKALDKAKASDPSYAQQFPQEALAERTLALLDSATITCFSYVTHRSMPEAPSFWRHSFNPSGRLARRVLGMSGTHIAAAAAHAQPPAVAAATHGAAASRLRQRRSPRAVRLVPCRRGLFERHRLIFALQLTLNVLLHAGELTRDQIELLVKPPSAQATNPVEGWLNDSAWCSVVGLSQLDAFASLPQDMEGGAKRWKEWCELEQPEIEPLPQEWKRLSPFERLMVVRALRPDRTTLAAALYVKEMLGAKYVEPIPFDLAISFEDSGPAVPIFFLLSPGVDPVGVVRALGGSLGMSADNRTFVTVSLGQGQEPVAEKALDQMYASGGWVMLQNIELVAAWLPKLEKKLEVLQQGAHPDFRVFLSALPQKVVPVPILQASIKLTNEPPVT